MIVKATKPCFVGGARRHPGDVFDYKGPLGKYLESAAGEQPAPVEAKPEITDAELRVKLGELGVKVAPATGRKKMLELLAEAEGK